MSVSGINKFRANFMQYILHWDCGLIHPRSVEETNSFFVASASDTRTWHMRLFLVKVCDPRPVLNREIDFRNIYNSSKYIYMYMHYSGMRIKKVWNGGLSPTHYTMLCLLTYSANDQYFFGTATFYWSTARLYDHPICLLFGTVLALSFACN